MSEMELQGQTSPDTADHSGEELFEAADFEDPETTGGEEGGSQAEPEGGNPSESGSGESGGDSGGGEELTPLRMKFDGRAFEISGAAAQELSKATGIPLDGLSAVIQKGLNYDRAVGRTPLHKTMEKFARANGMDLEQYQAYLEQNAGEAMVRSEIRNIREKYPNLDESVVRELAEGRLAKRDNADMQKRRDTLAAGLREQERAKEERLRPFREFAEKYPDITQFTAEEKSLMQSGMSPIAAHEVALEKARQASEIERLTNLLAQAGQKARNGERSPGSLSENSGETESDPFLQGLGF